MEGVVQDKICIDCTPCNLYFCDVNNIRLNHTFSVLISKDSLDTNFE